ncbi:Zn-dependent hydrolase [Paenibacillus allorhizosphaerae]|uniref:N-carbamoyl-L-amino acid hydrolase n=1 Tax=Paenibacillus allorhizosphaerae TaxID=2849866 RepID=A0ABM8VGI7_9BACL|nr:Zn-dependent hydrolase [Paenibacillus allorhizosphaerae]CAG7638533.1 N-carbamoyl-L-amino acid hydrolase [Paenibacillus allorhizosphaerae]
MELLHIDPERLQRRLEELGTFGRNERGGLDRTTFTPAELAARGWLKQKLGDLGLDVRVDPAANIWARREGSDSSLPVIAFGSHIDTVPNGGMYDGALGVLIALEVMQVLEERRIRTRHPLELVSFSAEEPNPFGLSTFGSRAVTGKLKREHLAGVTDDQGRPIDEALRSAGGDPERFEESRRDPQQLAAFLEVHIEQGKRLLKRDIPVGIVTAITGIYREEVTVHGQANHAGTTLMNDRNDALMAASEIMLAFEAVCRSHPADEVVGTVGKIVNYPNAANIIPEKAVFTMEIRGKTREEIQEVLDSWQQRLTAIERSRNCKAERRLLLDQAPAAMDREVIDICREKARDLGFETLDLGSMAGHDATHMAALSRSGMLFVPSLDGKSHCPEEESRLADIEKVANVLLHAIIALDQALE